MISTVHRQLRTVSSQPLLYTALIWFLAKWYRYTFSALFPYVQSEFGVSPALVGSAFTLMMTVYALMQFPAGVLSDRFGGRTAMAVGTGVAGVGGFLLAVPVPFSVFVGGMVLVGLGTGAHKTIAIALLSRVYPTRTGRMLGVLDTIGTLGGFVAPIGIVAAVRFADWHLLFLIGGVSSIWLAIATVRRVPQQRTRVAPGYENRDVSPDRSVWEYGRYFRDWKIGTFVVVTLCFSFAYHGVVAFLPLYLTTQAGLSNEAATFLYSTVFAVSIVQLFSGDLSDRVGQLPVILASLAMAASGLIALLVLGGAEGGARVLVPFAAVCVAFGVGSHGFRPVRAAYLTRLLPEDSVGGGLGVVRTLLMGSGAIAPAVVGGVATAAGYQVAFSLLATVMIVAVVLTGGVLIAKWER